MVGVDGHWERNIDRNISQGTKFDLAGPEVDCRLDRRTR